MESKIIQDSKESVSERVLNEQPTKEDLKQEAIKSKMSLRKQKLNTFISTNRKLNSFNSYEEEPNYFINIEQLQIPSKDLVDCDKFFNNFDINFLKPYLESKDMNYIKYSIHLINTYISEIKDNHLINLVNQLKKNYKIFDILLNLLNNQDKALLFNVFNILKNLVFIDEGKKLLVESPKFIEVILTYMKSNKYDRRNILNALLLLKFTSYDQTMQINLINSGIFKFLNEIYGNFYLYEDVKGEIISIISCFTLITQDNLDDFLSTIDILQSGLNLKYENIQRVLLILLDMLKFGTKVIKLYFEKKIDECLIRIYPSEKISPDEYNDNFSQDSLSQIRSSILTILSILSSLEYDLSIQLLINNGIFSFLNNVLDSTDPKVIEHVWGIIHGIAEGSVEQMLGLYQYCVIDKLIRTSYLLYDVIDSGELSGDLCKPEYKKSVYNAFGSTADIIAVVFNVSFSELLVDKSKYGDYAAIKILVKALKIFKDNKNICCDVLNVLNAIYKIFLIFFDEPNETDVIDIMIKGGLKDVLRELVSSSNSDISTNAKEFLEDMIENEVDKEENTNIHDLKRNNNI